MKVKHSDYEIILSLNGDDFPRGVDFLSLSLRESYLYTLPMLDLRLMDNENSLGYTNCKITDGSIINLKLTTKVSKNNKVTDRVRDIDFRVCKIIPMITIGSQSVMYSLACIQDSVLTLRNMDFHFTGTVQDCLYNIFSLDKPDFNLITDFEDPTIHNFKKLNTESFARYLKGLVRSVSNTDSSAFYCYYHDGLNISVLDVLAILNNDGDDLDYSEFIITDVNNSKMEVVVDSYTMAKKYGSYGATYHQYSLDTGETTSTSKADSVVKLNTTFDPNTKEATKVIATTDMGNHTKNYLENYSNNIRNLGIFSYKCWFRFQFPLPVEGLQCVKVSYKNSEPIPFILMNKEIRIKNGRYTEDVQLFSNTMDQSILTMFMGVQQ